MNRIMTVIEREGNCCEKWSHRGNLMGDCCAISGDTRDEAAGNII